MHVGFAQRGVQPEKAARHGVPAVRSFQLRRRTDHGADIFLECSRPKMWVLDFDLIDDVDAEVQMDRFVTQDILVLLGDSDHLVAAAKRKDLRKAGVEPHAFEYDIEGNEVTQECLVRLWRSRLEIPVVKVLRVLQRPRRLVRDRRHFSIHVEQLALIEAKAFDDVLEGVRMYRLFKGLPQQILTAFRIGQVPVDRQHNVVGNETLGCCEESEVALDRATFVLGEAVARFPKCDVGLH